jgi:hypothetical protein
MPGTKWHNDFVDIRFQDIEEWEDFNERNANSAFPSVINHAVPFNEHLEVPFERLDHRRRIHEEKDVDDYFLDVIGPILGHALGHSADKLCEGTQNPSSRKLRIPFAKDASKIALPQHASPDAWQHEKRPNFPIYLPAKSMPRLTPSRDVIHVIGDSARTRSLDPAQSFADEAAYKGCGRNHVGKLAMYCRGAGTCLAFTMTHVGVTVFRFFVVEGTGTGTSSRLGVQQRTFPWCPKIVSSKEECVMSGIKAIYVLLVMSLFPEGHALQERSKLRSLADWPKIK